MLRGNCADVVRRLMLLAWIELFPDVAMSVRSSSSASATLRHKAEKNVQPTTSRIGNTITAAESDTGGAVTGCAIAGRMCFALPLIGVVSARLSSRLGLRWLHRTGNAGVAGHFWAGRR
jgi:hypothetical protein